MLIQLDFDGTVVEFDWPKIGLLNEGCIEVIDKLRKAGHQIVLNTYRADLNDGTLEEAQAFVKEIGIFPSHEPVPTNERKVKSPPWDLEKFIENQILFIDDDTENIPLRPCVGCHLFMVDWLELDKQFRERGVY
jgi:hypothetical protein